MSYSSIFKFEKTLVHYLIHMHCISLCGSICTFFIKKVMLQFYFLVNKSLHTIKHFKWMEILQDFSNVFSKYVCSIHTAA